VIPVSAEQGPGVDHLLDAILERIPDAPTEPPAEDVTRIAVVGRPNVGKSSLVNRLLGAERLVVSETPGTTRDTVDVRLQLDGQVLVLLDTAGLRRSRTEKEKVDHVARLLAQRALERADVAAVMIDAVEGVTHQDAVVAGLAVEAGAAVVLLANKWDLVADQEAAWPRLQRQARERFKFASWAPLLAVSVRTGERLHRVFPEILRVQANRKRRVPTAELNVLVDLASGRHQPPQGAGGREFRVKYLTQVAARPPTFVAFTTGGKPHFTWTRFLENRLREAFDLEGTPVRIRYRGGSRSQRR
jgi:GTP-binding protein